MSNEITTKLIFFLSCLLVADKNQIFIVITFFFFVFLFLSQDINDGTATLYPLADSNF